MSTAAKVVLYIASGMTKILFWTFGTVITLVIVFLFVQTFWGSETPPLDEYTDLPAQPGGGNGAPVGSSGSPGFLNSPAVTPDPNNAGHYFIGPHPYVGVPDPTASENIPYLIVYSENDNSFTIGLQQEPIAETRRAAERLLQQELGLSEAQMCDLNATVSVPYYVNQRFAGADLKFSFCPNAVVLE